MPTTLTPEDLATICEPLGRTHQRLAGVHTPDDGNRQPVHTVYGGADLFRPDTAIRLGALALRSLDAYAADAETFGHAIGLDASIRETVYARVRAKLEREAVEDFRIDFEDGYGVRPDDEEDECAQAAASALAEGHDAGTLPPFIGLRIKPFTPEAHPRAIRTLDIFLTTLKERSCVLLGLRVTIPKVSVPEEAAAAAKAIDIIEKRWGLSNVFDIELMIETPESIIGPDGRCGIPALVKAAGGSCVALHFGVYDYTASVGITAQHQSMTHPACDHARHAMQVATAGTPLMVCDGATNIMPIAPHRGDDLTPEQEAANRASVHSAWKRHYDDVRHSLRHGFYQGWDLNPAQLPTRYAAVYAFYLEALDAATERLRTFVERAARATLVGDVFDDAATGQGLLNFFLRGVACGAITETESLATGLTQDELEMRSFAKILASRTG